MPNYERKQADTYLGYEEEKKKKAAWITYKVKRKKW